MKKERVDRRTKRISLNDRKSHLGKLKTRWMLSREIYAYDVIKYLKRTTFMARLWRGIMQSTCIKTICSSRVYSDLAPSPHAKVSSQIEILIDWNIHSLAALSLYLSIAVPKIKKKKFLNGLVCMSNAPKTTSF